MTPSASKLAAPTTGTRSTRKLVSEKTLELNISAEMLHDVRTRLGFGKAFWIGLTQQQEDQYGFDEALAQEHA